MEPRHLDLRPFILSGKNICYQWWSYKGCHEKNSTIVNSSQGGGSKDTWIIH
ncbi:MAG: hypothetical protein CM15mP127_03910 [Gammaproteobacteria bacterium]|nr:MAG: hypothetical protein CM15mP127_03910 [Gammaproteobacteria bacterium]